MNYLHQIPVIISAEVIILPLNLPVKLGDWVVLVLVPALGLGHGDHPLIQLLSKLLKEIFLLPPVSQDVNQETHQHSSNTDRHDDDGNQQSQLHELRTVGFHCQTFTPGSSELVTCSVLHSSSDGDIVGGEEGVVAAHVDKVE